MSFRAGLESRLRELAEGAVRSSKRRKKSHTFEAGASGGQACQL